MTNVNFEIIILLFYESIHAADEICFLIYYYLHLFKYKIFQIFFNNRQWFPNN
jgi:hypothetical protein